MSLDLLKRWLHSPVRGVSVEFGILPSCWHKISSSKPVMIHRAPHTGQRLHVFISCLVFIEGTFSVPVNILQIVIFAVDTESCVSYTSQTISDPNLILHSEKDLAHCQFSLDIIHLAKKNYCEKFICIPSSNTKHQLSFLNRILSKY